VAFKENAKVKIISDNGYLDSGFIKNHSFKFEIPTTKGALYSIFFPKMKVINYLFFIKESSEIHIELDSTYSNLEISGDQLALDQNDFWKQSTSISRKYRMIEKEIGQTNDSLKISNLKEALKREENKINAFPKNWVMQHRSSPFSVAVVRLFIAQNDNPKKQDTLGERYFDYLLPEAKENNYETERLQNLFSTFTDKYADNLFIKDIDSNNYIYLNDKKYSKIPLGSIAPDFIVTDTSGMIIKLSDFKNEYLLIDFWASWCGPCRANNPSLKKIYQKYRDKGLRILSISIDKDSDDWKNAIRKDGMNWIQAADLSGPKSKIATQYGAEAIPLYILLDHNKRIILKSTGNIDFTCRKISTIFNITSD
jgi:thiol-disulfide isomerase/thioredoxin